ncbi:MAG: hypothetical protein IT430_05690 [Phycisphaerales bacterium]|nr:hypothetical protein [Phycisphaerales bacterium]
MTSVQIMTNRWRAAQPACLCLLLLLLCGCMRQRTAINAPLMSPYREPVTWAVAPPANESGVSTVDTLAVADLIAREVQNVRGIDALPVQRVLDGMRAMDIGSIDSPAAARALARVIGADAIIVGSVTAYDPYRPPVLGLTLQLYHAQPAAPADDLIEQIGTAPSDSALHGFEPDAWPEASAAAVLNAADNGVRLSLEQFARGRTESNSALNWERYLVVMDLYTQYVVDRLLRDLLMEERTRNNRRLATANQRPAP